MSLEEFIGIQMSNKQKKITLFLISWKIEIKRSMTMAYIINTRKKQTSGCVKKDTCRLLVGI